MRPEHMPLLSCLALDQRFPFGSLRRSHSVRGRGLLGRLLNKLLEE
jgi:hypothetical protein